MIKLEKSVKNGKKEVDRRYRVKWMDESGRKISGNLFSSTLCIVYYIELTMCGKF